MNLTISYHRSFKLIKLASFKSLIELK